MTNDGGDFAIALIDQAPLTEQRIFDLAREPEPLLARPRAEVTERADCLLPWSLRGTDRLDEQIVGVDLLLVTLDRLPDEHEDLYSRNPERVLSSLFLPTRHIPPRKIKHLRYSASRIPPFFPWVLWKLG